MVNEETLGEKNCHILPTAEAGLSYSFICRHINGIKATANTNDTIRLGSEITVTSGYIESINPGAVVKLVAVNNIEWIATIVIGKWIAETS